MIGSLTTTEAWIFVIMHIVAITFCVYAGSKGWLK